MPLYPAIIAATFAFAAGILIYNEWDALSEAWQQRKKQRISAQFGRIPERSSSLIRPRRASGEPGSTTGYQYQRDIRSRLSPVEYHLDEYNSRNNAKNARSIIRESAERDHIAAFARNYPAANQTRGLSQAEIYGVPSTTEDLFIDDEQLSTPTIFQDQSGLSTPLAPPSPASELNRMNLAFQDNNDAVAFSEIYSAGSPGLSPGSAHSPFVSARASEDEWTSGGMSPTGEDWSLIDSGSEKSD